MLTKAGIKSKITETDYEHLKVTVDEKWYNLDPYLFDTSTPANGYNFEFFLFSDTQAYNYDSIYHYGQNSSGTPSATSTRFDFMQYCINEGKKNGIEVIGDGKQWDNDKKEWISCKTFDENAASECIHKYNPWVTGTWRNY